MFNQEFYHGLVQKYAAIFGTLFNNIYISKIDSSKNKIKNIKVPLSYGPKEKFLARTSDYEGQETASPTQRKSVAIRLPRMSYELVSINYNTDRKLHTNYKLTGVVQDSNKNLTSSVFVPVPYDFVFELNIMTKTIEDGYRIIEQIIPYFTPDWTVTAELIDGINYDVPVVLNSESFEDTYEGNFKERRALVWTFVFTVKGFLFGPTRKAKQIKFVKTHLYNDLAMTKKHETITVQPGLTANGEPTTDINETISYFEIDETDDYDYIIQVIEPDVN